ncbi:MAG: zinc ribbon domain-containing protein, partial [Acidimicrobiia bacterium]|nr:zinc ribbon domain-containing protein [Acidimicrobiia bacterium]
RSNRRYTLSGLIRCGVCGRRMAGQQNHDRPYYRCKFPDEYGIGPDQHPRNLYVKESAVTPGLDRWLASLFDDDHLEDTCEVLAGVSQPDLEDEARKSTLTEQIRDCDRRLGQYQAVLDEGADAKVVARWMAQVQRERANLEAQLGHNIAGGKLTSSQVRALVEALRDNVTVLSEADPADKAELYGELGVDLTYHPEGSISVKMLPRGVKVRVGGGT